MPDVDRFYREAADKASILVVAPAQSESGMRGLMAEGPYSFPVMLDQGAVATAYNVRYVPVLFLIDADGNLVDHVVGGTDVARLNELVDGLAGG